MLFKLLFISFLGLLSFTFNAFAIEDLLISASVFGTLGIAKSSDNDVEFRSRTTLPRGVDDSWSFENDSKLGVQVSFEPSDKFSATVQALTELNVDDDYKPSVEWAYLTYSPNENLKFRLGRTVFPTFMASDYVNVGFAYLPVRMPHDVYSLVPFSGIDGIDVIYDTNIGKTYLQIQALAAQRDFDIYNEGPEKTAYELRDGYGLRVTLKRGNWTASAGYLRGRLEVDAPELAILAPLLRSAALFYPEFGVLADELDDEGKTSFTSFGLQYSDDRFTISGEYVQRRWDVNMNVSDTDAYYILAGYYFGKWTPYAFYSRSKNKSDIPLDSYPTSGPFAPLTSAVNELFSPLMGDGSTKCIGIRYDLLENLAIKAQYEKIELGASLYLKKNGQPVPDDIDLYSLAVSFVY
jgi:hypothetical protein